MSHKAFLIVLAGVALQWAAALFPTGSAHAAPTAATPPATLSDAELAAFADGFFESAFRRSGIQGGAVVLVRDNRVVLEKGYGWADIGTRRRVSSEETLFRQASIAKLFVWLIAHQLVEEGRLDLDRDVNAYLDFRVTGLGDAPVTMRHLMTHTAGFADRIWGIVEPDLDTPLAERMRANIPTPAYAPGSTIGYSNYGAGLASLVIERAGGAPFEQLVEERIFARVGMTRSTFAQPLPKALAPLLASGYRPGQREPAPFQTIIPAGSGGLTASPADMRRFLIMLMNGGEGANGRVVRPETLADATRLHTPLVPGLGTGFGLGFLIGDYRGVRHIRHAGNLYAFATDLQYLPELGIGWYLAFNGDGEGRAANAIREEFARALVDRLLSEKPATPTARGPSTADHVAGSYILTRRVQTGPLRIAEPFFLFTVRAVDGGSLEVDQVRHADGTPRRWLPLGRDRFVEEETGIALVAVRDANGQVVRIASPLILPVGVFERAPAFLAFVPPLLAAAMLILLVSALSGPLGWATRKVVGAPPLARSAGRILLMRRGARAAIWLLVVTLGLIAIHFVRVSANGEILFREPEVLLIIAALAALCVPGALLIALDAVAAWRDPSRGWARRLAAALVAIAAIGAVWTLINFELITFSRDY